MIGPAYLCGLIFPLLVLNTCAVLKLLPDPLKPNAFSLRGTLAQAAPLSLALLTLAGPQVLR